MTTDQFTKSIDAFRESAERIAAEGDATALAIVLHDYESGQHFALKGDQRFHAASTIKVAVMLAVFRAIDDMRIRGDAPLHIRNRFLSASGGTPFRVDSESDGYPPLHRMVGRTAKILELAEWMIVSSSNLATNLLLDFLTVDYANSVLRDAGIAGVDLRRGVDDEKAFGAGCNNETTAEGLFALFAAFRSEFLSTESRDRAIHILLGQRFIAMIPAGLPKHASVAHKTGEISSVCHDAGIVYLPEREPYILVVLTESTAESDNRRETVARISEAAYRIVIKPEIQTR